MQSEQPAVLDEIRPQVRALLDASPAFHQLPAAQRRQLAQDMVRVSTYLAEDPNWLGQKTPTLARPLEQPSTGEEQTDPVEDLKKRLAEKPGQVGQDFKAGALREGTEQFGELVNKVNFPDFVSGLVNGVFKAVVDASIDQMRAYAELLGATAKTVDQFAKDHISDAQARDYVRERHPQAVNIDTSGDIARLRANPDAEGGVDLAAEFGLQQPVDLDDGPSEQQLVNAAKLQMARSRQQLMATMVLLGINRIVVTNGRINAKVLFEVRASDRADRRATAEMHDSRSKSNRSVEGGTVAVPFFAAGRVNVDESSHVATVSSATDDTSESRAAAKAQLSGDVRLNFRSETFPLERLVDAGGLAVLNERAQPLTQGP